MRDESREAIGPVRVVRWVLAGLLAGVLAGFVGGLLRRGPQPSGAPAYIPPEPAEDAHVPLAYRPTASGGPPRGGRS